MSALNSSSLSNITDSCECYTTQLSSLIYGVFAIIFIFLGFPSCLMVLWELLQRRRLYKDFYMYNLTTSDTLFIGITPFSLLNAYLWETVPFQWIDNFLDGLSLCSRPLFMACMCADCYFAVVHPIMYMTNRSFAMLKLYTTVTIWLTTIWISLLKCFVKETYIKMFNAVPLFIALPVIIFCDIKVLQALKKPTPSGNGNIHPQKKQAFHTISTSFIMTSIAYLPPVITFSLLELICGEWKCLIETFGFLFSMTGSVIMPILYLNSVGKLNNLKNIFSWHVLNSS